uniref:uncharacterized protein LOC124054516 n=1 Tax=Scatophagus argus TaxID=75038 RepID=UPI001ED83F63|nr:uncharacterized protein LOC124054516 [Scatophagus argus]XP_046236570.1 uncharacterized protein LOC124054516 [Scatophagus argus]XP_046236571.1 uncharacterized protein LOC124054516 [Scatophagus argus]
MMNFTSMMALLSTFSWISVSVSEFHTVELQPGEEATLMCSNFSSMVSHIFWFKLDNRPNISCISSMFSSDDNVSLYDGSQNGNFNMTSNITTIFLTIKQVDFSDSGLYFCGFNSDNNPVIVSATHLKVQVEELDGTTEPTYVILGALIAVLVMVIMGLIVKISRLQTAHEHRQNSQQSENLASDALTYATVNFHSKAKRRPASENPPETNVVYAATR